MQLTIMQKVLLRYLRFSPQPNQSLINGLELTTKLIINTILKEISISPTENFKKDQDSLRTNNHQMMKKKMKMSMRRGRERGKIKRNKKVRRRTLQSKRVKFLGEEWELFCQKGMLLILLKDLRARPMSLEALRARMRQGNKGYRGSYCC